MKGITKLKERTKREKNTKFDLIQFLTFWHLNKKRFSDIKKVIPSLCKQHVATPISNHYTSSRSLCGKVPISFNIHRHASVSTAFNRDITNLMQHIETSKERTLVSASSRISGDERDDYCDNVPFNRTILKSHNKKKDQLFSQSAWEELEQKQPD